MFGLISVGLSLKNTSFRLLPGCGPRSGGLVRRAESKFGYCARNADISRSSEPPMGGSALVAGSSAPTNRADERTGRLGLAPGAEPEAGTAVAGAAEEAEADAGTGLVLPVMPRLLPGVAVTASGVEGGRLLLPAAALEPGVLTSPALLAATALPGAITGGTLFFALALASGGRAVPLALELAAFVAAVCTEAALGREATMAVVEVGLGVETGAVAVSGGMLAESAESAVVGAGMGTGEGVGV